MGDAAKDQGLVALIGGILSGKRAEAQASEPRPLAEAAPTAAMSAPSTAPGAPEMPPPTNGSDERRARLPAVAIGDLVLSELRKMDGFPRSGVSITVYGYRDWNAMIRFAPFSTTSQNAARLRLAMPDIVFELRKYVELEG